MNDYLVRGMTMDGFVKVVAIRSTEMVARGAQIHKTTPNATACESTNWSFIGNHNGAKYILISIFLPASDSHVLVNCTLALV